MIVTTTAVSADVLAIQLRRATFLISLPTIGTSGVTLVSTERTGLA